MRRPATTTPAGRGRYRVRIVFPASGRWALEARLARRTVRLGSVAVRAPTPAAELEEPFAVAVDAGGRVLVADRAANRIVRIEPATAAATVVADVLEPLDVAVAPDGSLLVVSAERVVRVDPASGATTPVAGTGTRGFGSDGGPATAAPLNAVAGVGVDGAGNVYVAEYENRIRRVDAVTGVISTVAGTGEAGFGGDGGRAAGALLHHPHGVASADGSVVVADSENDRVRSVDAGGTIRTVAELEAPLHVAAGRGGALYVVADNRVHRIDGDGRVRVVAGTGAGASSGDGGPATRAGLNVPNHVAVAADGTLYVSELAGRRVRRVDGRTGVITTVAR